jgi:hypothetical protein
MMVRRFLSNQGAAWFEPRAVVDHHHIAGAKGFFRERYTRGRDYGKGRAKHCLWSRFRIVIQLVSFPLLPFWMTARSLYYAASSGRISDAVRALPIILASNTAWCLGEVGAHATLLWQ